MNQMDVQTKAFSCVMFVLQKMNNTHTHAHKPSSHDESRQLNNNDNDHKVIPKTKTNLTQQHKLIKWMDQIDARTTVFGCLTKTKCHLGTRNLLSVIASRRSGIFFVGDHTRGLFSTIFSTIATPCLIIVLQCCIILYFATCYTKLFVQLLLLFAS